MPTPKAIAREAMTRIKSRANPRRALQAQRYFKEPIAVYGLSAADMRMIAKDLYQEIKAEWTVDDAIALCDCLFPRPEIECKAVAMLVLLRFHKSYPRSLFAKSHAWLRADYLDNWALVDGFCPDIVGALLLTYPPLVKAIAGWAKSSNRWVRRASLVSFIKLARRGTYARDVYAMARRHFNSDDDLIHKATGWLLREMGKTDARALEQFLLRHGPRIPRTTLRYAIERFPAAKRRELLERTRRSE
jgi:3-methyladenine DNA glycosylase AlkD